jgi:hypothetical protein
MVPSKRPASLRYSTLRYSTLRYATQRYATLRYSTLRYALLFFFRPILHVSKCNMSRGIAEDGFQVDLGFVTLFTGKVHVVADITQNHQVNRGDPIPFDKIVMDLTRSFFLTNSTFFAPWKGTFTFAKHQFRYCIVAAPVRSGLWSANARTFFLGVPSNFFKFLKHILGQLFSNFRKRPKNKNFRTPKYRSG